MTRHSEPAQAYSRYPRTPLAAYFGMSQAELAACGIVGSLSAILASGGELTGRLLLDIAVAITVAAFLWPRLREYRHDLRLVLQSTRSPAGGVHQRISWPRRAMVADGILFLLLCLSIPAAGGWMSIAMAQFEKLTEQQREVSRLVLLACATRRAATILPDDLQQRCNGFTLDHVTDDVLRDGFSYLDRNRAEQHELMSSAPLSFIRLIAED